MEKTLDDLIHEALKQGAKVEIELCEDYGYNFKIGPHYLLQESSDGMPHEMLDFPLSWFRNKDHIQNLCNKYDLER